MNKPNQPLPHNLPDGLHLRWATAADIPQLCDFNAHIHEETPEEKDIIRHWVEDLTNGQHPTASINDFTVVVNDAGEIISSLCTIPQTWAYDGIPFPVGRIELVGTREAYRQRGLVRRQMAAVHAKGAARGEQMQVITGIPWYYRLFGYEMALNLGGGHHYTWKRRGNLRHLPDDEEMFSWRTAKPTDIDQLAGLYEVHCRASQISTVRNTAAWRHELSGHHPKSVNHRHWWLIQHKTAGTVAYVQFAIWEPNISVQEIGVRPGFSWREVALYLTRMFKGLAKLHTEKEKKPVTNLIFRMGTNHPIYTALGRQLEKLDKPYAWYVRLPNTTAFLRHIQPILEQRLAHSVMVGHTGNLRLNFYNHGAWQLRFADGLIQAIEPYEKKAVADGDAHFPDTLFTQIVCGRRTLAQLNDVHVECYGTPEAEILLGILFPKQASSPAGLG